MWAGRIRAGLSGGTTLKTPTDAVIYVVDSNDADRMNEARGELHKILDEDSNFFLSTLEGMYASWSYRLLE